MDNVSPDIAHHAALDARMVDAVRDIRLLALVSWPAGQARKAGSRTGTSRFRSKRWIA